MFDFFEFAAGKKIVFGSGAVAEVAPAAEKMGKCPFLVIGNDHDRAMPLASEIGGISLTSICRIKGGEPTVSVVKEAAEDCRLSESDLVIAFGGGSVLDAGKAIAALAVNPGDPFDYLEIVGPGRPLTHPPLPFIAIPTTAGTGSEVTKNAVLGVPEKRIKVSLRSPMMLPELAVVDPDLTLSMPPYLTAITGLDALTQVIEPFVSCRANPLTDALCRDAIPRAARALPAAYKNGLDGSARRDMSLVSLFGGLALANSGLGAVHGIAGPLGGMISAPHGALCAALLPFVMSADIEALESRFPESPALERYAEIAVMLTGSPDASPRDGVKRIREICESFSIPGLGESGLMEKEIPLLAAKAKDASSMKGNPLPLTDAEIIRIITDAF